MLWRNEGQANGLDARTTQTSSDLKWESVRHSSSPRMALREFARTARTFSKKYIGVPSPSIPLRDTIRHPSKKVFRIDPCVRATARKPCPARDRSELHPKWIRVVRALNPRRIPQLRPREHSQTAPPLPQTARQWPDRACPMADPITDPGDATMGRLEVRSRGLDDVHEFEVFWARD